MKFLKKFEAHEEGMSREEMCDMLCNCGYTMEELEGCSNYELAEMCRTSNEESAGETNESYESWTREEMCDYLCNCGYTMNELEECPNSELAEMCRECDEKNGETNEAKGDKWIKDAIKRPGALRKKMGKEEDEKITASEIKSELDKLKKKAKADILIQIWWKVNKTEQGKSVSFILEAFDSYTSKRIASSTGTGVQNNTDIVPVLLQNAIFLAQLVV